MLTLTHINDYLRHLAEDRRLAPTTIAGYREELNVLLDRAIPLDAASLATHLTMLPDGTLLAPNTRNRRLAILRGFCRYLREQGVIADDPTAGIRRAKVPRQVQSALTAEDISALVNALLLAPPSWRRTRDGTILLIFFYTGLRLSELVRLNVDQVDLRANVLRGALRKGGDTTDVLIHPCLAEQLALWLQVRPAEPAERALLPRGNTGRLSGRMIQKRLQQIGREAGLGVPVHPHLLRHAHATGLMRQGVATSIIQLSMNHHSLATTERYLHTDQALLRGAIERLPRLPLVPSRTPEKT